MKKNIIFLLKLRNYIFKSYQINRYYTFVDNASTTIMDNNDFFDNESIAILYYFIRNCKVNHIYMIRTIDIFNLNILMCMYTSKQDVLNILNYNNLYCKDYINKNIMSCILFACKFENKYFIFSTMNIQKCIKYDHSSTTHVELISYYFNDTIDNNKIWFSNDLVKYIKINNEFKVTKFFPYLINL